MANSEATQKTALVLLGTGIPAIGPKFNNKKDAMEVARSYVEIMHTMVTKSGKAPYKIFFNRQQDGRYALIIEGSLSALKILSNLDEIMLKRLKKAVIRNMLVITSFCEEQNGSLECLALTEGIGAVLYTPLLDKF